MKKFFFCIMATGLSMTFYPLTSNAVTSNSASALNDSKAAEATEARSLLLRLQEINELDKSNLKPSDKKSLRREVHNISHRLDQLGGGVYISVGALIIIILLLIILL